MGSSVRGAIDLALVLTGLAELRGEPDPGRDTARDAAYAALSGRIRVADGVDRTPESVIDELLDRLWPADRPTRRRPRTPREKPTARRVAPRRASSPARDPVGSGRRARTAASSSASSTRRSTRSRPRSASWTRRRSTRPSPRTRRPPRRCWRTWPSPPTSRCGRPLGGWPGGCSCSSAGSGPAKARGTRRLGPSRGLEGDLDLDRTLDAWTPSASRRPGADDIITRTWTAHRRAVCLVVDISGSMQGLAVALAAVAAAGVIVANEAGREKLQPSVLTFSAGVQVLQAQGVRRPPEDLLSELVALRGHGTTDLAAGLREASKQLAAAVADERMVVLLSDCLHTAGDDPADALAGIDRLHVLVPLGGPEAEAAAGPLAARGGGRAQTVRRLAEVGPALTRILS